MKRNAPIRIGITGGIGSGKSYVSAILSSQFGIPVYNCDAEAKRLNNESTEIREALIQLVGPQVYAPDGTLQKAILAAYLFASAEHASQVNAIVHPVVARDFQQWADSQSGTMPIVAMESAILLESGFDRLVDIVINVSAPHELCLSRAMQRDGATRQAIEQRMAQQLSDDERSQRAHHTLLNDGESNIEKQIQEILKKIK